MKNPAYRQILRLFLPVDQERTLRDFVWHGEKRPTIDHILDREVRSSRREEMQKMPQPQWSR